MNKVSAIRFCDSKILKNPLITFTNDHIKIIGFVGDECITKTCKLNHLNLKSKLKSIFYGDEWCSVELQILDIVIHPFNKKCFIIKLSPFHHTHHLYKNNEMFMMVNEAGCYFVDHENNKIVQNAFKTIGYEKRIKYQSLGKEKHSQILGSKTNLTDSNGTKLFIGDIVFCRSLTGHGVNAECVVLNSDEELIPFINGFKTRSSSDFDDFKSKYNVQLITSWMDVDGYEKAYSGGWNNLILLNSKNEILNKKGEDDVSQ